jgi:hypothetical protein
MIERDHSVPMGKDIYLLVPTGVVPANPVGEDNGSSMAVVAVVKIDSVNCCGWHSRPPMQRN